ncbi:MAG: hypothetical protein WDM80_03140 [Limisphaerales bacterium]
MTNDEFTDLFFIILSERIPVEARNAIKVYWLRFNAEPQLILGNSQIDSYFGKRCPIAAVTGFLCRHQFGFRDFIVEYAPEPIAQTIIQHELIHCYLDRNKLREDFSAQLLRPPDFNPRKIGISKIIAEADCARRNFIAYNSEEVAVGRINQLWGANDEEARRWIKENQAAKPVK